MTSERKIEVVRVIVERAAINGGDICEAHDFADYTLNLSDGDMMDVLCDPMCEVLYSLLRVEAKH